MIYHKHNIAQVSCWTGTIIKRFTCHSYIGPSALNSPLCLNEHIHVPDNNYHFTMDHNSRPIITQNSESFIRLFHTAVTRSPYTAAARYRPNRIIRTQNHLFTSLNLFHGNLITIYRGITYNAVIELLLIILF